MEPVTHILTGACLARTGLNRRAAYTTAAMAIAAEFPDIDTVSSLGGPVTGFQHHRGITHTFLGLPLEAAFLLSVFWGLHRWRSRKPSSAGAPLTHAPVRWGRLYGFVCLALLSHLLLDFTNNYGIRPFFPFDRHWYAASIVFIVDPLLLVLLIGALVLPAILGLVGREISGRREPFRGAIAARVVLLLMLAIWGVRAVAHARAVTLAQGQTLRAPLPPQQGSSAEADAEVTQAASQTVSQPAPERPLLRSRRSLASPDPFDPFRWYTATDFGPAYLLSTIRSNTGAVTPGDVLDKPTPGPMLLSAEKTQIGRAYLDWSSMPWITLEGDVSARGSGTEAGVQGPVKVLFHDVRFMGASGWMHRGGARPPLTGFVLLDRDGAVRAQGLDGKVQP